MKKILVFALCCALLAVSAMGFTMQRLTTDCTVNENGDCDFTQTIELADVAETDELAFPISEKAANISADGGNLSVSRRDGSQLVTLRGAFSGSVTVSISYTLRGCAQKTENGQLLTAELVCGQHEMPTDRYSFTVLLPKEPTAQPKFTSTYDEEGVMDKLTLHTEGRAISGVLRGGLLDREAFTMTLETEPGYFSSSRSAAGSVGQWIVTVLVIAFTALAVVYWFLTLRGARLRPQARTLPPDGVSPAELPLLLCGDMPKLSLLLCEWASLGYLTITEKRGGRMLLQKSMDMGAERREEERRIFALLFQNGDVCETDSPRYAKAEKATASLLRHYWTRRLYDRASGGVLVPRVLASLVSALALLNTMQLLLPAGGVKWLLLILAFAVGASLGQLICRGVCRLAIRDLPWVAAGAGSFAVLFLLARIGGGMLPMLLALALCVAVGFVLRRGGRLTAAGNDVVEQCIGFVRFLDHAEEDHLASMAERDPQMMMRMLVYACAAGLSEHMAKRLEETEIEPCPWLNASDGAPIHAALFCRQLARILKKLDGGQ